MKTKTILTFSAVLVLFVMSNVSAQTFEDNVHCSMQAWLRCVSPCLHDQTMCNVDCDMDWNQEGFEDSTRYQNCISRCQSQYNQCESGCNYAIVGLFEAIPIWDLFKI
jgi:hypothetical protein